MKSFFQTDSGKVRSHNEDSLIIVRNKEDDYLLAVADGMGGHRCGEVASSIAISYLGKHFQETFKNMDKESAIAWIREAAEEVNKQIFDHARENPESAGMGSTLVLAISTKDYVLFGNIGDSSGFAMKNKHLHKITYDHTLVNLLVAAGELSEDEAKNHPRKNVLMKALGANDPIEADIFDCDMNVDGIFLCSDGVTNMLEVPQIEKVLESDLEIEEKIVKLVHKCNNRGGLDNISMAYLIKEDKKETGEEE
jgi:protein phosphatase